MKSFITIAVTYFGTVLRIPADTPCQRPIETAEMNIMVFLIFDVNAAITQYRNCRKESESYKR